MASDDPIHGVPSEETGDVCTAFQVAMPEVMANREMERITQQQQQPPPPISTNDSGNLSDILGNKDTAPATALTAEQVYGPGGAAAKNTSSVPAGYFQPAGSSEPASPVSAISRETNGSAPWATTTSQAGLDSLIQSVGTPSFILQSSEDESEISIAEKFDQQKAFLLNMSEASSAEEEVEGGRLWEMATKEADQNKDKPMSEESARFARSILNLKSQSRAEVDVTVSKTSSTLGTIDTKGPEQNMIIIEEDDNDFVGAAVAKKRVRVIQLLTVGLVSFGVGLLGSLWTQGSCNFMIASDGQNEDLHYGLWTYYTPEESQTEGYCSPYTYDNEEDRPMIGRIIGGTALAFGAYAVFVLWMYLISGKNSTTSWNSAIRAAFLAGVLQLSLLLLFDVNACNTYECSFGPAAFYTIASSIAFFFLCYEMNYNMPIVTYKSVELETCPSYERPTALMRNVEMTDIKDWVKSYIQRIGEDEDNDDTPTLSQYQRKKTPNLLSPRMGGSMIDPDGYKPPHIV